MPVIRADDLGVTQNKHHTFSWDSMVVTGTTVEPVPPVPDLPAIVLLGVGLAGLATFIVVRRKSSLVKGS